MAPHHAKLLVVLLIRWDRWVTAPFHASPWKFVSQFVVAKNPTAVARPARKLPYRQPTLMARHENFFHGTKPVVLQQWSLQPTQRELGDDFWTLDQAWSWYPGANHGAGICTATFALKSKNHPVFVGKYTSTMDHMGYVPGDFMQWLSKSRFPSSQPWLRLPVLELIIQATLQKWAFLMFLLTTVHLLVHQFPILWYDAPLTYNIFTPWTAHQ